MPQDQVEEIKAKTDIVSLIGEYVDLKKAGRNYKALCPFHAEKTPSFMVSPELQIYKCFGCGESGDVFSFLEKHEGMDFYEALKFLADRAGVKLKTRTYQQRGEKQRLYEVNRYAQRFYSWVLTKHKAGKRALEYLTKERGLKKEVIEEFGIGYSPNKPFAMRKYMLDKKNVEIEELDKVGVVYRRGKKVYDRFRGRVIFPLNDHRGNIIGFAGRILPSDEKKDLAKYINSPETRIYHKGRVLYGLDKTKGEIKRKEVAIIVEGELDVISSWQVGIRNVAATKGTALTEDQVRLLSRYADSAILALDADIAGDTAARRGIEIAEREGLEVKVARLEKYKDPDEAARKDIGYYKKQLKNSVGVWDFIIDSIFSKKDSKRGEGKGKISREVAPVLASIDDKIVQAHYVKEVAKRLDVPVDAVASQVSTVERKEERPKVAIEKEDKEEKGRREKLEERLLTLAFQSKPQEILDAELGELIRTPLAKRILEKHLEFKKENKKFDAAEFKESLPQELVEGFSGMMLSNEEELVASPGELKRELRQIKYGLRHFNLEEKEDELAEEIKKYEEKKDEEKLLKAQKSLVEVHKERSKLERENEAGIIME